MSECGWCGKLLGDIAVKGHYDMVYCSSACCELGDNECRKYHGKLPPPIVMKFTQLFWWVCRMHGGGDFMVQSYEKPSGELRGENVIVAAGRYDVLYGPCRYDEAEDYIDDLSED